MAFCGEETQWVHIMDMEHFKFANVDPEYDNYRYDVESSIGIGCYMFQMVVEGILEGLGELAESPVEVVMSLAAGILAGLGITAGVVTVSVEALIAAAVLGIVSLILMGIQIVMDVNAVKAVKAIPLLRHRDKSGDDREIAFISRG